MSELNNMVRMLIPADKEFQISAVTVTSTRALFPSKLSGEYNRKALAAYNNSDSGSGELYWGDASVTPSTGMPIPKGAFVEIPTSSVLSVYFVAETGQTGDLRVVEIS
jgi:hypothetical protein